MKNFRLHIMEIAEEKRHYEPFFAGGKKELSWNAVWKKCRFFQYQKNVTFFLSEPDTSFQTPSNS